MPVVDVDVPFVERAGIELDARADEPAWQQAMVLDTFVTFAPTYDQEPTGRTVARVLADDRGLWFHFTAVDPEPARIRAGLGRRDTRWGDDWVAVYVDPAGEGQRAYLFLVNPLGVQSDGVNVSGANESTAWDGRWPSSARRTEDGYEVEFGVPWRTVRHPAVAEKVGLFVFRHIGRLGEKSSWPRLDPRVSGLLVQQGVVGGPGTLPKSAGLELIPEVTFGWGDDGPSADRLGAGGVSPGLTVRYAPTASLQLLGTFNPDFSQVESDQAQIGVNRRFALFFQEKRPFFLEGQEWFTHPFGDLFYTRSMVAPLYGARATVEGGGWTVAGLHVFDSHPGPSVAELGGWTEAQIGGAPALETVVRARKAVGSDTFVGAAFSDRTVVGADLSNRLGALDARIRLSDRWAGSLTGLGSVTTGLGQQVFAPAGAASLGYESKTVGWSIWGDAVHPDFRAENGYVAQTDRMGGGTSFNLDFFSSSPILPRIRPILFQGFAGTTTAGALKEYGADPGISWFFGNGGSAWTSWSHQGVLYGGRFLVYDRAVLDAELPWARWLTTSLGLQTGTAPLYDRAAPAVGWRDNVSGTLRIQPAPQLSAEFTGTWERFLLEEDALYQGWVGRLRLEAFASRRIWIRGIADRSTFAGTLRGEGLIAWEHSPGSALYLGGSRTVDDPWAETEVDPSVLGWQVFAKGSWVFTL